ncbi:hypothetical protein E4U52_006031 [Claviceps spartinae]|nr:hypothetical protein E4U52_006031 [Claviceps spartinae]
MAGNFPIYAVLNTKFYDEEDKDTRELTLIEFGPSRTAESSAKDLTPLMLKLHTRNITMRMRVMVRVEKEPGLLTKARTRQDIIYVHVDESDAQNVYPGCKT